jgi:up-regulated protein 5
MAGGEHVDESKFTGFARYFNSYTDRGRANVSLMTLSMLGIGILYLVFKPKKQKQIKSK